MAQETLKRKGGLAVLAGFCYLLLSFGAVVDFLYWMFSSVIPNWDSFVENSLSVSNIIENVVIIISFLVMAILMFIHKPAVVPGVGFILLAIGEFFNFFLNVIADSFIYGVDFFSRLFGSGWNIYNTLTAFAMVFIYLLMAILCFVGNNSFKVVRFIWFLPLVLVLLVLIIDIVVLVIDLTKYISVYNYRFIYYEVSDILRRLFEMIAVMFASMWIGIATKKPVKSAPAPRPPVQRPVVQPRVNPAQQPYAATPQYNAAARQPYTPAPQPASYDAELTRLKKLLDDGVITEEEFAAKKKQILGL